ncbi:hypothetical protein BJ741DRAFT_591890, partial [Chytriomyces cf. hyalinus JEL632]
MKFLQTVNTLRWPTAAKFARIFPATSKRWSNSNAINKRVVPHLSVSLKPPGLPPSVKPNTHLHNAATLAIFQPHLKKLSCKGCGSPFQALHASKPGYISPKTLSKLYKKSASEPSKPPTSVHAKLPANVPTGHLREGELLQGLTPGELKRILPNNKNASKPGSQFTCMYCHELKHYNKAQLTTRPDVERMVSKHVREHCQENSLGVRSAVAVLVVDASDVPGSLIGRDIRDLKHMRRVIVALNKVDLLPTSDVGRGAGSGGAGVNTEKLKRWVGNRVAKESLGMAIAIDKTIERDGNLLPGLKGEMSAFEKMVDVVPISAKSGFGIMELIDAINAHREPGDHVYLIGRPNAGKSQLINAITNVGNGADSQMQSTESIYPGTTVGIISRPLNSFGILFDKNQRDPIEPLQNDEAEDLLVDSEEVAEKALRHLTQEGEDNAASNSTVSGMLFDTPGIFGMDQITSLLTPEELEVAIPKKAFRPKPLKLAPGRSIFIGGLVRIDMMTQAQLNMREKYNKMKLEMEEKSADEAKQGLPESPAWHPGKPIPFYIKDKSEHIEVRVFASNLIPIHSCRTIRVDNLCDLIGVDKQIMYPPIGPKRLHQLGGMKLAGRFYKNQWKHCNEIDVAIGGIGWVTLGCAKVDAVFEVYSISEGMGVSVRPSLLGLTGVNN